VIRRWFRTRVDRKRAVMDRERVDLVEVAERNTAQMELLQDQISALHAEYMETQIPNER
jgi:hypothetical protein